MKVIKPLLLAALLGASLTVAAKDDGAKAREEAERLLEAVKMEASFANLQQGLMQRELKANPQFSAYRDQLQAYFDKHVSYAGMKDELVALYASEFSADELRQISRFYGTEAGQKALAKMPSLLNRSVQLSVARVEKNAPELEAMINEEALRRRAVLQKAVRQGEKMSAEKAAADGEAADQGPTSAQDSTKTETETQD